MKNSIALIGCGGISSAHLGAARALEIPVAAVVDPDATRREARAAETGGAAFASVEAMLADPNVTRSVRLAVVCTPPGARLGVVRTLLDAGIPTLVEKPLAHQLDAARALIDLANTCPDVPTAVGFCHRYTPAIREIAWRMARGEIGTPVRFENVFACDHPTMQHSWMSDPAVSGGGSLIDTACHSFDLFQHLMGPARLEAAVLHHGWVDRGDTNATVLLRTAYESPAGQADRPVAGTISSGWREPARFRVTVVGSQGLFDYDYEKPEVLRFLGIDGTQRDIPVETHETRFTHQLRAFVERLDIPTAPTHLAGFAEAAEVNRLVDEAQAYAVTAAV